MPKVASPVEIPLAVSAGALGRVLGVSERVITGRKGAGRLPTAEGGQIDLRAIIKAGVNALAVAQRSGGDPEALDLQAERARLAKEQADAQELRNAATRGELVPRVDVVAGVQTAFAAARARLLGIPSKAAPLLVGLDDPAAIRDTLTDLVHECCGELAATRAIPADSDRAENGRGGNGGDGDLGAAATTDGERMGRQVSGVVARGKRRAGAMDYS